MKRILYKDLDIYQEFYLKKRRKINLKKPMIKTGTYYYRSYKGIYEAIEPEESVYVKE